MGAYDVGKDNLLANLPRTSEDLPRAGSVVIHQMIGEGGMGAVYLGFDENLAVEVAVKVLPFKAAKDASAVERFFREARSTFKVDHQNVVRVLTVAEEAGTYYLVMEFVDGESADALLKRDGPLPERDALEIAIAAGEALAAAHANGILHRDVKPANIMIRFRDGRVKIADLGLAKALGGEGGEATGLTATGQMLGTPAYMSPEQAEDASRADERTDVYSLGATLYALLSGKAPFEATQLYALLRKVVSEKPADLFETRSDVSARTAAAVSLLMSKDASSRPQTMSEAVSLLRACHEQASSEGARGLARPSEAGRLKLTAALEERTPTPAPPRTLDDVTPDGIRAEGRTPRPAVSGVDEVVEKRLTVEERRSRFEPGEWKGEREVVAAADRDLRVAKEVEDKDPGAALARLARVQEALDALEERRPVAGSDDWPLLQKFGGEANDRLSKAVTDADGKLRTGDYAGARHDYRDAEEALGDAVRIAQERKSEYERLLGLCRRMRTSIDRDPLKAHASARFSKCRKTVDEAEKAVKAQSFDSAESMLQSASEALNQARDAARPLRQAARRRLKRTIAIAAAAGALALVIVAGVAAYAGHRRRLRLERERLALERRHALERASAVARVFADSDRYDEAVECLRGFANDHTGEAEAEEALSLARTLEDEKTRKEYESTEREARRLADAGDYDAASRALTCYLDAGGPLKDRATAQAESLGKEIEGKYRAALEASRNAEEAGRYEAALAALSEFARRYKSSAHAPKARESFTATEDRLKAKAAAEWELAARQAAKAMESRDFDAANEVLRRYGRAFGGLADEDAVARVRAEVERKAEATWRLAEGIALEKLDAWEYEQALAALDKHLRAVKSTAWRAQALSLKRRIGGLKSAEARVTLSQALKARTRARDAQKEAWKVKSPSNARISATLKEALHFLRKGERPLGVKEAGLAHRCFCRAEELYRRAVGEDNAREEMKKAEGEETAGFAGRRKAALAQEAARELEFLKKLAPEVAAERAKAVLVRFAGTPAAKEIEEIAFPGADPEKKRGR